MAITSYEQIVKDVLLTGATPDNNGERLMLEGTMLQANISEAIAEAKYVGEIFRDGMNVTKRYSAGAKFLDSIRVPLATPYPATSRTVKVGARAGTPGNEGLINRNPALMPADDEFIVVLNQLNDQPLLFPELATLATAAPLRDISRRIASFTESVVEDESASTLAEILAYNIYRYQNGADNINTIDITADGAYATLLNSLNTKLSNGDAITGAHTYGTQGRCIVARSAFINNMFNTKSGIIVSGSDIAQNMLRKYNLDDKWENRDFKGNAYRGYAMQFDFCECVDFIWSRAEEYLGLAKGALDHVIGIAVSFEATAAAEAVDVGVKIIDAQETRGMKAQPLNCWGHEAFRLSQLIGDANLNAGVFTTAGFTADERKYPVAPSKQAKTDGVLLPILNASGEVVGYKEIAKIPQPNGGVNVSGLCDVSLYVTKAGAAVTGATIEVTAGAMDTTVTEVGNGFYSFNILSGEAATVKVTKGSDTKTITITKKQSELSKYATNVVLG